MNLFKYLKHLLSPEEKESVRPKKESNFVREEIPCVWRGTFAPKDPAPGDCYYSVSEIRKTLSLEYKRNTVWLRPPIVVVFPTKDGGWIDFCIDSHPGRDVTDSWDIEIDCETLVEGAKPNITVSPSINIPGFYHGWLKKGMISK